MLGNEGAPGKQQNFGESRTGCIEILKETPPPIKNDNLPSVDELKDTPRAGTYSLCWQRLSQDPNFTETMDRSDQKPFGY